MAGDTIFNEGDTGDVAYVVVEGDIELLLGGLPLEALHSGGHFR